MKHLKLILIMMVSLSAWTARALPPVEEMIVQRFTDLGEQFRWEVGTLFCSEGFIGNSLNEYSADLFLGLGTPEVLAAISGKFVSTLEDYTFLSNHGNLECFPRSVETYSINNVAYVIVSLKGAKPSKPIVSISAVDDEASEEGQDIAKFMVFLDAPTSVDIRVRFKIKGTAKKNKDYISFPAKLLIPAGNVSGIIEVIPVDDFKLEETETVILKLKPGKRYKVSTSKIATIHIIDND